MSKITAAITPQHYELIAPQIVSILKDELSNQFTLTSESVLDATILLERSTPANQDEYPMVTVRLATSVSDNKDQSGDHLMTSTYSIEAYVNSANTDSNSADELSSLKVSRLLGVIREILLNPAYAQLDLEKGIVRHVGILNITPFNQDDNQQSMGVTQGQLLMEVQTNEDSEQLSLGTIVSFHTTLKECLSGKEYEYLGFSSGVGTDYENDFIIE